jgi:hypothetical protein
MAASGIDWAKENKTTLLLAGGLALACFFASKKSRASHAGESLAGYGWYEPKVFPAWWPGRGGCDDCDPALQRWRWAPSPRWGWTPGPRWGWSPTCYSDFVGSPTDDNLLVHWYGPASDGEFYDRVGDLRKAGATCSDDRIARCAWRGVSFAVVHDVEGPIRCHITSEGSLARPAIWAMIDPVLRKSSSW